MVAFALAVIVLSVSQSGGGTYKANVNFVDPSISLFDPENFIFTATTQTTYAQVLADAESNILSQGAALGYTFVAGDIQWGAVSSAVRSFATPTRSLNSAFKISTNRDSSVSYAVDIVATLSLTSGQTGTVTLEYADDSGFTTNVKTVQPGKNGNTGSLTIGLNLGQTVTATVSGMIPAGKYVRLRTTQVSGAPTFSFLTAQEVLL